MTTQVGGFDAGLPWQAQAALALSVLGDRPAAVDEAAQQLQRARCRGAPGYLGLSLRVCGLVSQGDERIDRLTEAIAVLEGSSARLELAKARCDLGIALLRAGKRSEGGKALQTSLDEARRCGARGLAELAYEELKITGARPRRPAFSGLESLTASVRRVATMAAQGLTNREIAQSLFVTPKTVETHLSHVFAKLGVASRRELRSRDMAGMTGSSG